MAWIKVPAEHHPLFMAALPKDPRVEVQKMFGGLAAKVNGHIFAGLFGLSTMLYLDEPDRSAALALEGASWFDPMGTGKVRSDKIMLPEALMHRPRELAKWIAKAFAAVADLPPKVKGKPPAKAPAKAPARASKPPAKAPAKPRATKPKK
jgi:hypothetical protein